MTYRVTYFNQNGRIVKADRINHSRMVQIKQNHVVIVLVKLNEVGAIIG